MSHSQGSSSLKRKRQDLTEDERVLYNLIHSKKDMGIWIGDMKQETNLPESTVTKSLKSLQSKNLIKEVVNFQNKERKHYMAAEFEPSKEITGGIWYNQGSLDTDFINLVKDECFKYIFRQKVATSDEVLEWCRKSRALTVQLTTQHVEEILRILVLDDEIVEEKSPGFGDFTSVPVGGICYRCKSKCGIRGKQKPGATAMASIPCGVCPRINSCTYYQKWLDF